MRRVLDQEVEVKEDEEAFLMAGVPPLRPRARLRGRSLTASHEATRGAVVSSTRNDASGKPHVIASIGAQLVAERSLVGGIADENVRYQVLSQRSGTFIVMLVDTSGSMVSGGRMAMAKGCVLSLLRDAYVSRDRVAMVTFGGKRPVLAVPPTQSPALAAELFKRVKIGGRTPLVGALRMAWDVARQAKDMPVLFVVFTDGIYSKRFDADPEGQIRRFGALARAAEDRILVVDTETKDGRTNADLSRDLARLLGADYRQLDELRVENLRSAIEETLAR